MSATPELKELVDGLLSGFETFKKANDERIVLLEKGRTDPLIEEKINKANEAISTFQAEITAMKRLPVGGADEDDYAESGLTILQKHARKAGVFSQKDLLRAAMPERVRKTDQADRRAYKSAFQLYMKKGTVPDIELMTKAMSEGSDPDGGYFVPPDMSGRTIVKVFETSEMRKYANVETTTSDVFQGETDMGEAGSGWVGETEARTETTSPTIGQYEIPVREIYAAPKITQRLLDDADRDVGAWLEGKISDRFARQENLAFILGDGAKRPRGLYTYSTVTTSDATRAWGTFQHVISGAAADFAASNPSDALLTLIYTLKNKYRQNAVWTFPRVTLGTVRRFKDGDSNYLWVPGIQAGQPSSLMGYPVAEFEDVPIVAADALATGFGDLRETYTIVDRFGIRVLRDPYTSKPYVIFYATKRVGGDVVNFDSFKFLKISA